MDKYVLMADIIDSRELDKNERKEFQKKFINVIEILNNSFEKDLSVKLVLSAGDSIQGVFNNLPSSFLYYRLLTMIIKPIKMRGVVSKGDVWEINENNNSNQMDGPAFHQAKENLDLISISKRELLRLIGNGNYRSLNLSLDLYSKLINNATLTEANLALMNELINPIKINLDIENLIKYITNFEGYKGFNETKLIKQSRIFDIDNIEVNIFNDENTFITRGIQKEISEVLDVKPQYNQRQFSGYVQYERMIAGEIYNIMKEVG